MFKRPTRPPVLAPRQSGVAIHRLLQAPAVREAIRREALRGGDSEFQVERRAAEILHRVLPDFRAKTIHWLVRLAGPLFRHMYQPITTTGLSRLQSLAHSHQLIYLPCHRSHMDYLLLGWVQYHAGLTLPGVVAGDNLNLPLIGSLLRRGGALFMRRRFRDDPFYSALFKAALHALLHNNQPLEYFIEGGRSRTGRLLPARLGLLSMTLDAPSPKPLALVPIAINYDRCLENRAYQRELAGQDKQPESLLSALLSASALVSRCGGCYLQVGEPLLLNPDDTAKVAPSELAHELLGRINAAMPAAPVAQLATLLLASPDSSLTQAQLIEQLTQLNRLLGQLGLPTPAGDTPARWIDAAVARRQVSRAYQRISLTTEQAAGLCYYRNTLLHALALPGVYLLLAARLPRPGKSSITRILRGLLPYLDAELHLATDWRGEDAPARTRSRLIEAGLLRDQGSWVEVTQSELSACLMRTAERILLRQYLLVRLLDHHRTIGEQQLLELLAGLARHIHPWYGHSAPDYADPRQLRQLLQQFEDGHLLRREAGRVSAQRDLAPIIRVAAKLLPRVLQEECGRWLGSH